MKSEILQNFYRNRKLLPYWGGKRYLIKHLLPLIPKHYTYVEVFGGGASLLFAKTPSPIEVYNDIDQLLANFFNVFINQFNEFQTIISILPFSDYIRKTYIKTLNTGTALEKAIKTFYLTHTNWGSFLFEDPGLSRALRSLKIYQNKKHILSIFRERIKNVIIENQDFKVIIPKYDNPNTFFYLDPPYLHDTRIRKKGYNNEMSNEDHIKLLELITNAKGKIMLSCYDNPIYQSYLKDWNKLTFRIYPNITPFKQKPVVIETVYLNYEV